MAGLKLLGGLGTLAVLVVVVGSLAGLLPALVSNSGALVVFALVVAVAVAITGLGLRDRRNARNPYW